MVSSFFPGMWIKSSLGYLSAVAKQIAQSYIFGDYSKEEG